MFLEEKSRASWNLLHKKTWELGKLIGIGGIHSWHCPLLTTGTDGPAKHRLFRRVPCAHAAQDCGGGALREVRLEARHRAPRSPGVSLLFHPVWIRCVREAGAQLNALMVRCHTKCSCAIFELALAVWLVFLCTFAVVIMVYEGDTKVSKPVAYLKKGQTFGVWTFSHAQEFIKSPQNM